MKKCLACGQIYAPQVTVCPTCSDSPTVLDGFPAYAPALAASALGFRDSYFADLAPLEASNFWFRARNRLIIWALQKYCPDFGSLLEIGCGTGYVLSGIADAYPNARLHGSEIFTAGLAFAASRQPSISFMQMDARQIPYTDEFDVIGAFDVLEHIEDDSRVLAEVHRALTPGGLLMLTVPQHPWLWSAVDDYACHVRRYTAQLLHTRIRAAGFEILRSTSFVFSLLPLMFASRMLKKTSMKEDARVDAVAELRISPTLNGLFEKMIGMDIALIQRNIDLPVGGSRFVVAKRI